MSANEPINLSPSREAPAKEERPDVMDERISFQLLQGMARIESRLERIENRLSGGTGVVRKVAEKPNLRNQLTAQLLKGWTSEAAVIEQTGWQTIGVRSFVTKLRTLGLSVETEERDGVPHYRIAK